MNRILPLNDYFTVANLTKLRDTMFEVSLGVKFQDGNEYDIDIRNDIFKGGNHYNAKEIVADCVTNHTLVITRTNSFAKAFLISFGIHHLFMYELLYPSLAKYKIQVIEKFTVVYANNHLNIERALLVAQLAFNYYTGHYIFICTTVALTAISTLEKNGYLPSQVSRLKNKTIEYLTLANNLCSLTKPRNILFKTIDALTLTDAVLDKLNIAKKGITVRLSEFVQKMYIDQTKLRTFTMFNGRYRLNSKHLFEGIDLTVSQGEHKNTLDFLKNLIEKYKARQTVWGSMKQDDFIKATFGDDDYKAASTSKKPTKTEILNVKKNIIESVSDYIKKYEIHQYGASCTESQAELLSYQLTECVNILRTKIDKMDSDAEKDAAVLEFFKKLSYCKAGLIERLRTMLLTEGHAVDLILSSKF